jgi:hypothetical protein
MGKYNPLGKLTGVAGSSRSFNYYKRKFGSGDFFLDLIYQQRPAPKPIPMPEILNSFNISESSLLPTADISQADGYRLVPIERTIIQSQIDYLNNSIYLLSYNWNDNAERIMVIEQILPDVNEVTNGVKGLRNEPMNNIFITLNNYNTGGFLTYCFGFILDTENQKIYAQLINSQGVGTIIMINLAGQFTSQQFSRDNAFSYVKTLTFHKYPYTIIKSNLSFANDSQANFYLYNNNLYYQSNSNTIQCINLVTYNVVDICVITESNFSIGPMNIDIVSGYLYITNAYYKYNPVVTQYETDFSNNISILKVNLANGSYIIWKTFTSENYKYIYPNGILIDAPNNNLYLNYAVYELEINNDPDIGDINVVLSASSYVYEIKMISLTNPNNIKSVFIEDYSVVNPRGDFVGSGYLTMLGGYIYNAATTKYTTYGAVPFSSSYLFEILKPVNS